MKEKMLPTFKIKFGQWSKLKSKDLSYFVKPRHLVNNLFCHQNKNPFS